MVVTGLRQRKKGFIKTPITTQDNAKVLADWDLAFLFGCPQVFPGRP